eukprot:TRINITY_DN9203_c0_g2_i1.p1 TRINITY_DN9203_c0_g2~~TRINITY_DN9203_c0_g2_i1.p1  ORF type:complete len:445 (+),score=83.95 TRINITY_DN9203_c0_g2_i1:61-1395(+)
MMSLSLSLQCVLFLFATSAIFSLSSIRGDDFHDARPYNNADEFPMDSMTDEDARRWIETWMQSNYRDTRINSSQSPAPHMPIDPLYETFPFAKNAESKAIEPNVTHRRVVLHEDSQAIHGHLIILHNPGADVFSIIPPANISGFAQSQTMGVARVSQTSVEHECMYATNAGFFSTKTLRWLGYLVSDGKHLLKGTRRNAAFGLLSSGQFFTGYVPQGAVNGDSSRPSNGLSFRQLVSGVLWLVRKGRNYVEESLRLEDMTIQESGGSFATMVSARTALGHNSDGELMILQIDGKSWKTGVSLKTMADVLIQFGAYNAINLDGGGSSTVVAQHQVVNQPSDGCLDSPFFRCERQVTSATCIHRKDYKPICTAAQEEKHTSSTHQSHAPAQPVILPKEGRPATVLENLWLAVAAALFVSFLFILRMQAFCPTYIQNLWGSVARTQV